MMERTMYIPLTEKRLLTVKEFQEYASIGRNNAFKMIQEIGCGIRVGRKILVDRECFDKWCSRQCS